MQKTQAARPRRWRRQAAPLILAGASAALIGGGVLIASAHGTPLASSLDHQVAWPARHAQRAQPVQGQPVQGQAAGPASEADGAANAPAASRAPALDHRAAWPGRPGQARHAQHPAWYPPTITIPGRGTTRIVAESVVSGSLGVPADVHVTGWDIDSAGLDSARGSTVIDGHVNYAGQGAGFFSGLASMHAGQAVTTTSPAAFTSHWRVATVRLYPKAAGLPSALFSTDGPRQLALISCGGPFNWATGHYLDNVVVVAVPARGTVRLR